MSRRKIKVGLLGLGRLGNIYARCLAHRIPQTELVAVADPAEDRARLLAEELSIPRWYSEPLALVDDKQIDAVVIATPTITHQDLAEAAAGRGKPIFCEKPLSLSLQEASEIKRVVDRTGVFFQMGFMRRFDRAYLAGREKIEQNVIGRPLVFKATSRDPYLPSLEYLDPKKSGGLFIDMGIHDFDLARWLMGEVNTVGAIGGVLAFPEVETVGDIDNAVVTLVFAGGQIGMVDLSRSGLYGYDVSTEILGTKGTLRIGYLRETPLVVLTRNNVSHDTVPYFPERFGQAYLQQLQNFAENLLSDRPPPVTIDDGIEALRIGVAATRAYRSAQTIKVASVT